MAAHILLCSLSLLLAFNIVAAAPTTLNPSVNWKSTLGEGTTTVPSGFSIQQARDPNWTPRSVNIIDLHTKALRKYNALIPPSVERRSDSTASARAIPPWNLATNYTDEGYRVPIQVGTPPQTIYVIFDTGSGDIWVYSSGLPASELSGRTVYSPALSSTSTLGAGQNWSITYGDTASASGDVYFDHLGTGTFVIPGFPIETALQIDPIFDSYYDSSGIWGIDLSVWQAEYPSEEPTWFAFVAAWFGIKLFTVNFVYFGAGTITFGTIDSTQYTGSIAYAPLLPNAVFWSVNITGFTIGDGQPYLSSIGAAILDTGTTLTYLLDTVVSSYWSQVPGSSLSSDGNYYWPCSTPLPDLHLRLQGGGTVTIHGQYLNPYGFQDYLGYVCLGGLQSADLVGANLIGWALYQSMFVVFDYGNVRVGFASKTLLD